MIAKAHRYGAKREVLSKNPAEIDARAAKTWADRAVAAYEVYAETGEERYLLAAREYRREALEHAGAVGDFGRAVRAVQERIDRVVRRLRIRVEGEGGPIRGRSKG